MRAARIIAAIGRLRQGLRGAVSDRTGIAAVEMALASPLLIVLLLGTSEVANLLKVHYKAAQMASTIADAVARYNMVTSDDVAAILSASSSVMGAGDFAAKGYVILTSVTRAKVTDSPMVAWQCRGGGTVVQASRVGTAKGVATLPGALALDADDNVIVAEVFYNYSTLFDLISIPDTNVYKSAVFRPRLGALTTATGC